MATIYKPISNAFWFINSGTSIYTKTFTPDRPIDNTSQVFQIIDWLR